MRRSKQPEAATSMAATPQLTPAALPRARTVTEPASHVPGLDDLERGRTAALIASLGRVQLTLDLIERRLGRLEQAVAALTAGVADVPAQTLLLLDVIAPAAELSEVEEASQGGVLAAPDLAILEDIAEEVLATAPEEADEPGLESQLSEDNPDGAGLSG